VESQEEKRKEYKEIMKDVPAEKVVYIDESGIEERITKIRVGEQKVKRLQRKRVVSITREAILSLDT
jgi:hypothetical protein